MLSIKNLNLLDILHDINLNIAKGIICGILGASGSGKTTLLKCIKNFRQDWTGSITYNNNKIDKFDTSIGYVFQETILYNHLSLMDNLKLTGASLDEIKQLLVYMNIDYLVNKHPAQLSGGEKQRIGICRSFLQNPTLLLMDEPTSALDFENKHIIFKDIEKLNKEKKITIIMISHDMDSKYLFDKTVYMDKGSVV